MEKKLVTVVLPIYNVEKYLNRCIESIVRQTYKNLEIILVDDGSPDCCPDICNKWAEKDKRIKVVHKQNAGLGMARNTGIKYATGEYICFFDSDDYVELNTIEKCLETAKKNNAEVICFGYSDISKDGKVIKTYIPHSAQPCYRGEEVQTQFLPELLMRRSMDLNMSAWSAMYLMETIRNIKWQFVSEREIISEDVYSLLYLYRYVDCVAVLEQALYNYCDNGTSLTRAYKEDRYEKIKHFYTRCIQLAESIGYDQNIKDCLVYPYLANTIATCKHIVELNVSFFKKISILSSILKDETLLQVLDQLQLSRETKARRCFFYAIKNKMTVLCYIFLRIKGQIRRMKFLP